MIVALQCAHMAMTVDQDRVLDVRRYRFDVDAFARMGAAGVFTEDERVELIDGEVREMTPIGPPHAGIVNRLNELLVTHLAGRATVIVQNPIRLDRRTEPQPDIVVARRRKDFYAGRHPKPGDVLLVVEVADASVRYDRAEKAPRYGRAGIPETWLVDVEAGAVTAYADPGPEGYARRRVRRRGERMVAASVPDLDLAVDDVFGGE